MEKIIDKQFVTYSNYLIFEGKKLAFKNKNLYDLSGSIPKKINQSINNNSICWWVGRKCLSVSKAKELVKKEPLTIDISELQWYQQCDLQIGN